MDAVISGWQFEEKQQEKQDLHNLKASPQRYL